MAFIIKNRIPGSVAGVSHQGGGLATVQQYIHVARPAATITQNTATEMLFRVFGGRVLVHLFLGEVTTIIQAQACTLAFASKKLDNSSAVVGTAVTFSGATASLSGQEVGSTIVVLGSGNAAIVNNAGASVATLGRNAFILPQGELYATASANNTGALKYDLWYQPVDEAAYVQAMPAGTAVI